MAVNRVPVLKKCRALGLEPQFLGYSKKSNRQLKNANRKVSEYGLPILQRFMRLSIRPVPPPSTWHRSWRKRL